MSEESPIIPQRKNEELSRSTLNMEHLPSKDPLRIPNISTSPIWDFPFLCATRFFRSFWAMRLSPPGLFLNNFNSSQGNRITGPLVNLPIHAGLGYKMFRILRLNAGAVLPNFEEAYTKLKKNYIQPYVGVSLEINLWMGLNDRR